MSGDVSSFSALLGSVKAVGEDYEFYPTTSRIVEIVARRLDKHAESIMDIGAGDGRVLAQLAERFKGHGRQVPLLYAIEKSTVLIQAQPEDVIPVGTELFEQNLACLPVDEAGRLLGWLQSPDDVVKELGYSPEEAAQYYSCTKLIESASARLLLGSGEPQEPEQGGNAVS